MRSVVLGVVVFLLGLVLVTALAEANQAAEVSHGPSIPFFAVRFDDTGDARTELFPAGAGYSLNFNFYPSEDGAVRWLAVGVPMFARYSSGTDADVFALALGATVGVFNNLLAVGAAADLVNVNGVGGRDTGLFLGDFDKRNVAILVAVGFNFGAGATIPASSSKHRLASDAQNPPPCYISLGRRER